MTKALGKCPLEGKWVSETCQLNMLTYLSGEAAGGTHIYHEQGPTILTRERRSIGHEGQLVGDGFGSGVVVHVL